MARNYILSKKFADLGGKIIFLTDYVVQGIKKIQIEIRPRKDLHQATYTSNISSGTCKFLSSAKASSK